MFRKPKTDPLDEILNRMRSDQISMRERGIEQLQGYVEEAGIAAADKCATEEEAIDAEEQACLAILQQNRVVESLLKALEEPSLKMRAPAAVLLGRAETKQAQEQLLNHFQTDPADEIRILCGIGIMMAEPSPRRTAALLEALQDPSDDIVVFACIGLGENDDMSAVEPLRNILTHSMWEARFRACEALVSLGAVDATVVKLLEELNASPEAEQFNEMVLTYDEDTEEYFGDGDSEVEESEAEGLTTYAVLENARLAFGSSLSNGRISNAPLA